MYLVRLKTIVKIKIFTFRSSNRTKLFEILLAQIQIYIYKDFSTDSIPLLSSQEASGKARRRQCVEIPWSVISFFRLKVTTVKDSLSVYNFRIARKKVIT